MQNVCKRFSLAPTVLLNIICIHETSNAGSGAVNVVISFVGTMTGEGRDQSQEYCNTKT